MTFATPYDGSSKLFQIGTKPLEIANWFDPDSQLEAQLREKDRLFTHCLQDVYGALPTSLPAQRELLEVLSAHLPSCHPDQYVSNKDGVHIISLGETRSLRSDESPLLTAAKLVQDDLLLLQRDEEGWRLTAAALCFPSSWVLADKLGKVLADIHTPVPGFGPGTRAAQIMARMFDAARPETPMIRWNFSLYGDHRLHHPDVVGPDERRFGNGERADPVVMRVERQTLRKLPKTNALAFTIRISLDPLERLVAHPSGAEIASSLITQILELTPDQLDYKGLTTEKERVLARLREIAAA